MGSEKNLTSQENFNIPAKDKDGKPHLSNLQSENNDGADLVPGDHDDQKGTPGTEIPDLTGDANDGGGAGRNNGSDKSGR